MSQKTLDNLVLLALFLTAIGDLIGLFVEIKSQQQISEEEDSEEINKKEMSELHNEINLLKSQLEDLRKNLVSTKSSDEGRNLRCPYLEKETVMLSDCVKK